MWTVFDDTWNEEMPASDPKLQPPADLFQPLRGLGKVWREHQEDVREPLGWATTQEVAYQARLQTRSLDERHPMQFILSSSGQVYVLHPGETRWKVR